jgi:hypothetical protein
MAWKHDVALLLYVQILSRNSILYKYPFFVIFFIKLLSVRF